MKRIYSIILVLIALIFSGCSDPSKVESVTFKNGSQEFEIHYYLQEYQAYIEQAKNEKDKDRLYEMFEETVLDALVEDGLERVDAMAFAYSITDTEAVRAFEEHFNQINKTIKKTLRESSDILPSGHKKIYVLPASPDQKERLKEVNYVLGFTRVDEIVLIIDPEFEVENLEYTVAHEYHHSAYKAMKDSKWDTLLEQSVLEGKADFFASSLYPDVEVPWTEPLKDPLEAGAWKAFMEEKDVDAYYTSRFIGGDLKTGIPKWALYRIGSEIMNSYMERHPETSVEEWTKKDPNELFTESGLIPE